MTSQAQKCNQKLPQDWHAADIKAALEKAGWSLRKLAFHHGFKNGSTLNLALRKPYPNAERIIARALGLAPEEIWPSRYDHRRPLRGIGGAPAHVQPTNPKFTTHHCPRNVNQGQEA